MCNRCHIVVFNCHNQSFCATKEVFTVKDLFICFYCSFSFLYLFSGIIDANISWFLTVTLTRELRKW